MREYQPKPLNKFQQGSAPRSVSDEKFSELKEQMTDETLFFRNSTYSKETVDPATGIRQKVWFDKNSNQWIADFTFPDGTAQNLEADSRDDLLIAIAAGHGEQIAQEREAELEANPVFNSVWEKTAHRWLTEFKWGQRFSKWVEWLPEYRADEVATLIRTRAYELYYKAAEVDPKSLEASYISLLDAGKLDEFENEAAKIKKQCDAKAAKALEQNRITAERVAAEEAGYDRAMAQHEAIEAAERVAEEKKLSKTKKGMHELRRRALFGSKENAFPVSTGTAVRIP